MSRVVFIETVRRHFTSPGFLVFVGIITVAASITGAINSGAQLWLGFWSLLVIAVGAQLIGPEFSSGTLQLIIAKPVNRAVYLVSRWAAVVVSAWAAMMIALLFDLGGRFLVFSGPADWKPVLNLAGGEAVHAVLACALLALFGSISRSYFNVAIYFVVNIGLLASIGALRALRNGFGSSFGWLTRLLNDYPGIIKSIETIHGNLNPSVSATLRTDWAILVVSNTSVVLLLACLMFRRREVPYGAD